MRTESGLVMRPGSSAMWKTGSTWAHRPDRSRYLGAKFRTHGTTLAYQVRRRVRGSIYHWVALKVRRSGLSIGRKIGKAS